VQYVLLIYDDEALWGQMGEEERGRVMQEYFAYTSELQASGKYVGGEALQPTGTAKTVTSSSGERIVTDGPFAETKEQLGGFYLVDVDTEDEAIEWAGKIPSARFGRIEVRAVMVFDREGAPA